MPQESIYVFKPGVTQTYTDVDAELFGLDTAEIWLVRAAFAVLKNPQLGQQWQAADQAQQPVMQAIYQSAADGRAIICEVKYEAVKDCNDSLTHGHTRKYYQTYR